MAYVCTVFSFDLPLSQDTSIHIIGLDSLFTQGKPLANGNYSRHPRTIQYDKQKPKTTIKKGKKGNMHNVI